VHIAYSQPFNAPRICVDNFKFNAFGMFYHFAAFGYSPRQRKDEAAKGVRIIFFINCGEVSLLPKTQDRFCQ